jgi:hypothetical protein
MYSNLTILDLNYISIKIRFSINLVLMKALTDNYAIFNDLCAYILFILAFKIFGFVVSFFLLYLQNIE